MYIEDLTLCRYHRGVLDADSWQTPLLAVGWLEHPHRYAQGDVPANLVARLEQFVHAASEAFAHEHFRGLHCCSLCSTERAAAPLELSYINLLIPGSGVVYASPAGILHYMAEHSYLPPSDFIAAVNACPDYGSEPYLVALRQANGGHPVFLITRDQWIKQRRTP